MTAMLTPMFPLESVLVPGRVLPLHIFEPRYRALARHCVENKTEFGVVLIARGHEVGGGDIRCDVGCLAHIQRATEAPDGRWGLVCIGTDRIRVLDWRADDPYPQADVELWPDIESDVDLTEQARALAVLLRRTLALGSEAGYSVAPATTELSTDPYTLAYQAASLAPIGDLDMYNILAEESTASRLEAVTRAIAGARELIELELRGEPRDET